MEKKSSFFSYLDFCDKAELCRLKEESGDTVTVVVPTLNEEKNLRRVLSYIKSELMDCCGVVDELLVLDGGSQDLTCEIAHEYTEHVYDAREGVGGAHWPNGKGLALWRSQFLTASSIITFVDADIENFDERFILGVIGPLLSNPEFGFSKSYYKRPIKVGDEKAPSGGGRVTEILVRPYFSHFFPAATELIQPLSGEYGFRRSYMGRLLFYTGYGVETSLVLDFIEKFGLERVAQVDLGERVHRNRPLAELGKMAYVILQTLMEIADTSGVLSVADAVGNGYCGLVDNEPVVQTSCAQVALPYGDSVR